MVVHVPTYAEAVVRSLQIVNVFAFLNWVP